ncbi:hypothetical protein N7523_005600 [Penicillium sp. IBT 18751x]|nr:hypothetical protein N7523_005808 [Penicillium sp. IBT 18751x]KAJ6117849.1 hypothetical protein N7523_005600 [Penicillium sp. IBT 18751x]
MLEMTLESVDSSIVRWEPYSYARQPPTPREDSIPPPRLVQDTETGLIRRIRVLDNFSYLVECPQSTQSFQTCIMAGFPDKALCGPWTTDKVDLLFNLWWNLDRKFKGTHFRFYEPVPSGYMIPEVRPQAYEEGIKKALINGNAAVIICLLDIRRCALLQSNETRKHARLPDEIFALALYYCTRRRDILQMLVQADLEWQWAHPEQTNSASLPKTDSTATARDLTQAHLKELAYDVTRPRPSYDVPWPGVG